MTTSATPSAAPRSRRSVGAPSSGFTVGAAVAGLLAYLARPIAASVVASIATLALLLAMLSPLGAHARLERGLVRLREGVGRVLTFLLLTPVFYGFFMPYGLLFRRGDKDPLERALDEDRDTYWQAREARSLENPY